MEVFPGESPEATAKKLEAIAGGRPPAAIYDKLFVRHWDTWSDGRRSHLFVVPRPGETRRT